MNWSAEKAAYAFAMLGFVKPLWSRRPHPAALEISQGLAKARLILVRLADEDRQVRRDGARPEIAAPPGITGGGGRRDGFDVALAAGTVIASDPEQGGAPVFGAQPRPRSSRRDQL